MTAPGSAFVGSVPENYNRHLGPLLFEPYARDIVSRLPVKAGMRVLELACGTGIVTRALLGALPGDATLVATDFSEPMLAVAQQQVSPDPRLAWQKVDAVNPPFDDASFDVIVCQFGLMFFPDRPKAAGEMRRMLQTGGVALVNTWDSMTANAFVGTTQSALTTSYREHPPQFLHTPYGLFDTAVLQQLFDGAGFASVSVERVAAEGKATSRDVAVGFIRGSGVAGEIQERGYSHDAGVESAVAALDAQFGAGKTSWPLRALVVSAKA